MGRLAVLIDPEKGLSSTGRLMDLMSVNPPDFVFVGGSTGTADDAFITSVKERLRVPVVLFPGNPSQISEKADRLLFLSLISGRNPELLIGQQVKAAARLVGTSLEVVPTGYMLIDGGRETTVQRVSGTTPIARDAVQEAVHTAYAGQLLGMQAIYLEAGSGALQSVPEGMIRAVKSVLSIPLIVGGGIRSREAADAAWQAGADLVVVGNALEQRPELYSELI